MQIVGPGKWATIHAKAIRMTTPEEVAKYPQFIREQCELLMCDVCQGHCREYQNIDPPEREIYKFYTYVAADGQSKLAGPFLHSWNFHNAVNARLGKPLISFEDAYKLFDPTVFRVCGGNCGK